MKKIVIMGYGELGRDVISKYAGAYDVQVYDPAKGYGAEIATGKDVLNVCIDYSKFFIEEVSKAISDGEPKLTVIHSTVPVGTTDALLKRVVTGTSIVYAPKIKDIKYIGADTMPGIQAAMAHLGPLGYTVKLFSSSRLMELSTTLIRAKIDALQKWEEGVAEAAKAEGIPPDMLAEIIS